MSGRGLVAVWRGARLCRACVALCELCWRAFVKRVVVDAYVEFEPDL